jgi:superfamily II DNA/RNA helicase
LPKKSFFKSSGHAGGRVFKRGYGPSTIKRSKREIDVNRFISEPTVQATVEEVVIKHAFMDFALPNRLQENLKAIGYQTPTPIQDSAIPPALTGKDVIGIANTGTGKTAAFLLPLIAKMAGDPSQKALVIAPTRELALQINQELRQFARDLNIHAALCTGGTNIQAQIATLARGPQFVIGTPGRLKDLIQRKRLNLSQTHNLVLDEVDRMVDIGFLKDMQFIIGRMPSDRQSLFFSATVSPDVRTLIDQFMQDPVTVSVKTGDTTASVNQDVIRVRSNLEKQAKLSELLRQPSFDKVIVFGRTKHGVERLSKQLSQEGFQVASIHGNKSQGQRTRALDQFKKGQIQALIATDVAARGLDIPNVSHVINYDVPATYDDYVHRIGRTGRAEATGHALTFVGGAA